LPVFYYQKDAAKRSGNGSLGVFLSGGGRDSDGRAGVILKVLVACLLAATSVNRARADDLALIPKELGISAWDQSYALRSGAGYKDNVLLNDQNVKGSGFFDNGFDLTLLRLPIFDDWEAHFMVTGDDIRYWKDVGDQNVRVDHEDLWVAMAEASRTFGDDWKAGSTLQYAYINQVVDVFDLLNQVNLAPTKVEGHTFIFRPMIERALGSNYWVRLELEGTRLFLTQPADSFWQAGPRVLLGRTYGHRSELQLSYTIQEVGYDHETQTDAGGIPIPGTSLRALKQELGLASEHYWDARRRWHTTTKLGLADYRDNGSGYYNYHEYSGSGELHYSSQSWELKGSAGIAYRDFPIQNVTGSTSSKLHQLRATFGARIERQLFKTLKIFAAWEAEISLSNSEDEVYHANTFQGGLAWEF
jgi:hypothetical protein